MLKKYKEKRSPAKMEEAGRSEEGISGGVAGRVKGNISYSRILQGVWGGAHSRYIPPQQCKC